MELMDLLENYKSANLMKDATEKNWCITPLSKKTQQVTLDLNGKRYNYACRYDVQDEDVAIVGYQFPAHRDMVVEASPNTGKMAMVKGVSPTLTIKKDHAVEIDYVFSPNSDKNKIQQCVNFLLLDKGNYATTLQFDKLLSPIRPIHYYIQRILSAVSILANSNLVTEDNINMAKKEIFEYKKMYSEMNNWAIPSLDVGVDLSDVQIFDSQILEAFEDIEEAFDDWTWEPEDGVMMDGGDAFDDFVALEEVNDFINKYSHLGAVSIMVRGGFLNLLKAYLSTNPPIDDYYDELCQILEGIGHKEVFDLLKAYEN